MESALVIDERNDESLISAVAGGDRAAFRLLAERYMNMLYSVAFRMHPAREDAEDIVQEILLRIWNKADMWRPDGGAAVKTWIYRLAYNLCIDHKRKNKKKMLESELREIPSEEDTASRKLQRKQTGLFVTKAVDGLPVRQKAAVILCYYEGLTNAEAADAMGISVKAIESLLVRGRRTLQAKLSDFKEIL